VSSGPAKYAVLLLAHGSPERPEDVPEFLLNITGGRPLPQATVDEVTHRYSLIGRSPLTEITLKQGEGVSRLLGVPVYVGMRNWRPSVVEAVEQMVRDGITKAVAICLAPQDSRTSVGLYRKSLFGASRELPFAVDFVDNWHDHPLLVSAFAEKLVAGWEAACAELGARLPVIFTAHSVPQRTISEGDPYEQQARETAALIAQKTAFREEDWAFAFQSQGMSGGEWLGPTVEATILGLKAKGHTGVFVQPIGFLCDHVEVLYDIDIAFQTFAREQSMRLWRAESLNESPLLLEAIADVARGRMAAAAGAGEKQTADFRG
jgi:protoporphyrin/coproporphyrin ferrochelatase